MANGTQVRRVLLQFETDDGDAEAKLDRISAKADELKDKHPELAVKIDTAAANAKLAVLRAELKDAGKDIDPKVDPKIDDAALAVTRVDLKALADEKIEPKVKPKIDGASLAKDSASAGEQSGGSLGGAMGIAITAAVVAALAALPALAAGAGALAGIALGGALLIGSSTVKGPLYAQFQEMISGLMSVLRVAALPLVKPLGDAFAQVGKWAKNLYPELHAVFASLGPLVAPLARGLEGLVSGVMPGFLRLMQAARPAVSAVAGVLSSLGTSIGGMLAQFAPAVKSSSQFLTGLSGIISSLIPVVGELAGILAKSLGPWMATIGAKVAPILAESVNKILQSVTPLIPGLAQLTGQLLEVGALGIASLAGPIAGLLTGFAKLAQQGLPPIISGLQVAIGWLTAMANAANRVLGLLSHIPGLGFLAGAGAGISLPSVTIPAAYAPPSAPGGYDAAAAAAGEAYGGNWADGVTAGMLKTGQKTTRPAAANLGLILSQGLMAGLTGTAAQVQAAISKLLGAVNTDVSGKYLTQGQGTAISDWLEKDQSKLVTLADKRARILATIAKADAYAANVTTSAETTFGVVNAAGSITPALGVGGIMRQLLGDVAQIRVFRNNIAKLRKMGLNKAYIDQLIQAGPVQGGEVAAELAAGNEGDIRGINKAESQIAQASVGLGRTAAEVMFDSGKNAGKGFLSGLESQQKALEAAMRKLADVLVSTIKKELRIHSPSQVAYELFAQVPAGAVLAIDDGHTALTAASQRMARAALSGHATAGGGAGGAAGHFTFEWVGGSADAALITLLKKHIRVHGGDPAVLGS